MTESGGTPPGWYVDNAGQRRWWDGNAWTEHVDTGQAAPAAADATPGTGYGQAAAAAAVQPAAFGQWPPPWYLEGGPSDFQGAIRNAINNIFEYRGRASRSSYWWFVLAELVVVVIAYALLLALVFGSNSGALGALILLVLVVLYIGLFLVGLSLTIRRLHDTSRSGWWYLIAFVPFVGGIILLVFTVLESTPGPNQYNIDLTGATHSL